ncbi:hypothetical protein C4D60_Mb08t15610 [Musa balbisiana]|uniref:Annexin n=1 Tax=Musa balbisiana TaxID=52838 RepID=A0A4S8K422_MUSBA|nr:hypothetical protein C4D60_Mb08t15610 [Musa balbisiana]
MLLKRKQIRLGFEEQYKENLRKESVYRWILDSFQGETIITNIAVKKNIDYQAIIEIACVSSPKELLVVKEEYHARYKRSLEGRRCCSPHTHSNVEYQKQGPTLRYLGLLRRRIRHFHYEGDDILTTESPNEFASPLRIATTVVTLEYAVAKETSGDCKSFLLPLVGN